MVKRVKNDEFRIVNFPFLEKSVACCNDAGFKFLYTEVE